MERLIPRLSAAERTAFIAAACSLLTAGKDGGRVRFKHRGRSADGVDCVGLVAFALKAVGREVEDRRDYGRDPVREGLRDVLVRHFGSPVEGLRAGDVLLMRWHEPDGVQLVNHVAVAFDYPLGGIAIVHALKANEEVVAHRFSSPWPRRHVATFRP